MSTLLERITTNPDQGGGRPCVQGTRTRVVEGLDLLLGELTHEQILAALADLEPADIKASMAYANPIGTWQR